MLTLIEIALSNAIVVIPLAALIWLLTVRCHRPALIHGLYVLLLLKLITPPLWTVSLPETRTKVAMGIRALEPEGTERPETVEGAPPPSVEPQLEWHLLLGLVWALGTICCAGSALLQIFRFRKLLSRAVAAPPELQRQTEHLARGMGLSRCPGLLLLPGRFSPFLWALGRAHLLLPLQLLDRLDRDQTESLIVHELAHLRRRDHWVRALELVVIALFWWHPVVWWARARLQEAEEQCCDAWVVSLMPSAAGNYALALVETLDFLSGSAAPLPIGASGLGSVPLLKRRVTMIMAGKTARALTGWGAVGLFCLGFLLLPLIPAFAGEDRTADEQRLKKARKQAEKLEQQLREQRKRIQALERRLGRRPTDPNATVPEDPVAPQPPVGARPPRPSGPKPKIAPRAPMPLDPTKRPRRKPGTDPFDGPRAQPAGPRPGAAPRTAPKADPFDPPKRRNPGRNPFGTPARAHPRPRPVPADPALPPIAPGRPARPAARDPRTIPASPAIRNPVPTPTRDVTLPPGRRPQYPKTQPGNHRRTEGDLERRVRQLERELERLQKEIRKRK